MFRKKSLLLLVTGSLIFIVLFSYIQNSSGMNLINVENTGYPRSSATLDGADNILVTNIDRDAEISGYGLVHYTDSITFKNLNNNPITAVFIGVQLSKSDDLIFFEAQNKEGGSLYAERAYLVMDQYEMIAVYFDTPLLPQQSKTIKFRQTFKDSLIYTFDGQQYTQYITYIGTIYPLLPYNVDGDVIATYTVPDDSTITDPDWGTPIAKNIDFNKGATTTRPFLEDFSDATVDVRLEDKINTKLEVESLNREIYISPWGIIRVKEDFVIINTGAWSISTINLQVPGVARSIFVSDNLGEVLGVTTTPTYNYTRLLYKDLSINLLENRVRLLPYSKVAFTLEYVLTWENYSSVDWFQESINIDMLTTICEYLGKEQTTRIKIDGCARITSISETPTAIENEQGSLVLVFESDYVSPLERRFIQFTFQVDIFDIILRPVILFLLIVSILSSFVVVIKTKKEGDREGVIQKEFLPASEIREFCSLLEEKTALTLEIRQAEDDTKKKKMAKKRYRNILTKNTAKIDEIEQELITFKKIVRETNQTFELIVNKLEILEAERISVKDSLNLLENRYKRGKLPSRGAYLKLSDNFLRRRRKIDRTIDKLIQQLRSYLL